MISLFQMHSWSYNWRSVGERILLKQEAWSLHLLDGTTAFISERVLTIMWHSFYEGGEDGCSFIQFSQLHHPSLPFIACQCNAPMVSVYIRMLQAIVSSIPVPFAGSGLKEQCLWDQFPSGSRYYVQHNSSLNPSSGKSPREALPYYFNYSFLDVASFSFCRLHHPSSTFHCWSMQCFSGSVRRAMYLWLAKHSGIR